MANTDQAPGRTHTAYGDDVQIGDNVIMEGDITIGDNTRIDHGCILRGNITIGHDNWLYPYCVVGTGPQHQKHLDSYPDGPGMIQIGDHNVIREFCTIHRPVMSGPTRIGSHLYMMAYSHIPHDGVIGDHVIIGTHVTLGGHVHVHDHAYVGQDASIHPFCRIGKHAMVGMNSSITKDVPPFALINRQVFTRINHTGMERAGISAHDIDAITHYYKHGTCSEMDSWYVREIEQFRAGAKRHTFEPDFQATA